jgi:hypothetical protein
MSNLKSHKFILVLGVASIVLGCASNMDSTKDNTNKPASISSVPELKSIPGVTTEDGWGVNPRELSNSKDVNGITEANWYTKRYPGKASSRSIELKSSSYMESTCKQAVKKENGKSLIESSFTSLGLDLKPEVMTALSAKITKDDFKKIEVNNCQPTSAEKTFSECECALSYKVQGGKKAMMEKVLPQNK